MKTFSYASDPDLVLERLPGLFPCNVRDPASSSFSSRLLLNDFAVRSFYRAVFWFPLLLLCLYTWLSLVSLLVKRMELGVGCSENVNASTMVTKRSFLTRDKVAKNRATKTARRSFDEHAKMKMQESLDSPAEE